MDATNPQHREEALLSIEGLLRAESHCSSAQESLLSDENDLIQLGDLYDKMDEVITHINARRDFLIHFFDVTPTELEELESEAKYG